MNMKYYEKQAPKHLVSHHSRTTLHNLHIDRHQLHQHLYTLSSSKATSSVPLNSWWPRSLGSQRVQLYSTLTHIDSQGKAHMVDVSAKQSTTREATACATVLVGPTIAQLIHANNIKKGDVLSIAQIAGIMGAKRTSELIPLCHNIVLSTVKVEAELQRDLNAVQLRATVRCCGQTGVEMEALTAVSIAALTVYDMCKAVSHDITITNVRLMAKSGGKRDFQRAEGEGGDVRGSV